MCGLFRGQGYLQSTSSMSDNKSKCLAAEKLVQKLSGKLGDNRSDHAEKLVEDKEVLIPRQSQCCLDYAIDIIIITIIVIIITITITITIMLIKRQLVEG